jgi:predicted Zn-dependent peptidase
VVERGHHRDRRSARRLALDAERMASGCRGIDADALARAKDRAVNVFYTQNADPDELRAAAIFGEHHPYDHVARVADLARITLDDVCRFIDAYYAPDRAVLVISGHLPAGDPQRLADRFAALPRSRAPSRTC